MSNVFAISVDPRPVIPVLDHETVFPVRRVYCIGRNYAAHAREMGGDPSREAPFFFQKSADTLQYCPANQKISHPYPSRTTNYHHEIELVVALKSGGIDIKPDEALDHVYGYAVGLDMTRRDLQDEAKATRRPWEIGKSADYSAPIGPIRTVATVGHPTHGKIELTVDGEVRQSSDLSDMIWSIPEQIAILSTYFELKAGDVIFTGTPEGVGKILHGQTINAFIETIGSLSLLVE